MRRCYLLRESQEKIENERNGGILKFPRMFKFPPIAFFVCIFEIPQNKNQAPFLFFIVPKENPLRHLEGTILPYWHDYKFVGKVFAIYTDLQISPCCNLHYRQYYKNLEVGTVIYTDRQISPSIALLILKFPHLVYLHENYISTIWGNLTISIVTDCEVLHKVIS